MRLESYLIKEGRSIVLSEENAKMTILDDHMKSFTNLVKYDNALYRGHTSITNHNYGYIQPSKHKRTSANTQNYYTLFLDVSPKFKAFPKRSQSLICGNKFNAAYGTRRERFIILPKDGSKIGVIDDSDFWDAFQQTYEGGGIQELNNELEGVLGLFDIFPSDNNAKKLMSQIREFDNRLKDARLSGEDYQDLRFNDLWKQIKDNGFSLEKTLNEIFDPKPNKILLLKAGDMLPQDYNRECWTDGDSVMINALHYQAYSEMFKTWL